MSTNVGDNRPETGLAYTVAELVARERAAARAAQRRLPAERTELAERTEQIEPTRAQRGDATPTRTLHVNDLLRREGARGQSGPAEQAPPAPRQPQQDKRTGTSRAGTMGKAAVLFGLTVGGIVGLQSTLAAPTDDSATAARAGAAIPAPRTIDQSSATSPIEGGGATPTTSADVTLKDNATTLDTAERQGGTSAQAPNGSGASERTHRATEAPTPTSQAQPQVQREQAPQRTQSEPTESRVQPPSESSQHQASTEQPSQSRDSTQPNEPSQSSEKPDGGNGALNDVLDPVTGTVSGVLDAGTGLLGL